MSIFTCVHIWIRSINIFIIVSICLKIEFYLIKWNLITFLERKIAFSFVWAWTFDRARTFTRTFDQGFVRGEYNDLKFCKHLLLWCWNFHHAAGKSGMEMMNFFLVEGKLWWWIFLLYSWEKENVYEFFIGIEEKKWMNFFSRLWWWQNRRGVAEQ